MKTSSTAIRQRTCRDKVPRTRQGTPCFVSVVAIVFQPCDFNSTVSLPAPRLATYEDVLNAPEYLVAEIVNGTLHTHPRPSPAHAETSAVLGMDIGGPFHRGRGGPGGWWILDEPELHLGPDILVPDLAGWRRERLPQLPEQTYFTLAPDWCCEVLSPSTARMDRTLKVPAYARENVLHLWLVDPIAQTLEALVLDGESYRLHQSLGGDARARIAPFAEVELELAARWSGSQR